MLHPDNMSKERRSEKNPFEPGDNPVLDPLEQEQRHPWPDEHPGHIAMRIYKAGDILSPENRQEIDSHVQSCEWDTRLLDVMPDENPEELMRELSPSLSEERAPALEEAEHSMPEGAGVVPDGVKRLIRDVLEDSLEGASEAQWLQAEPVLRKHMQNLRGREIAFTEMRYGLSGTEARTYASIGREKNMSPRKVARIQREALRQIRRGIIDRPGLPYKAGAKELQEVFGVTDQT